MNTEAEKQPWEQRENESAVAYRAFAAYRDLRADRSFDQAYHLVTGAHTRGKRASGRFRQWASDYEWLKRAQAYDAYLERKALAEAEGAAANRHREGLVEYQERQRKLSAAATNAAIGLLTKAGERLKELKASEISAGMLPSYFRAAAAIAESASNSEAQSLAVEELLRTMEGTTA